MTDPNSKNPIIISEKHNQIIDANVIIALLNQNDTLYSHAKEVFNYIDQEQKKIFLEDIIFVEIIRRLEKVLSRSEIVTEMRKIIKNPRIICATRKKVLDHALNNYEFEGDNIFDALFFAKVSSYPSKTFMSYNTLRNYIECHNKHQIKSYKEAKKELERPRSKTKNILLPIVIFRLIAALTNEKNNMIKKEKHETDNDKKLIRHKRMLREYDNLYSILRNQKDYPNISIPDRSFMKVAFALHDRILYGLPDAYITYKAHTQNKGIVSADTDLNKLHTRINQGDSIISSKNGLTLDKIVKDFNKSSKRGISTRREDISSRINESIKERKRLELKRIAKQRKKEVSHEARKKYINDDED